MFGWSFNDPEADPPKYLFQSWSFCACLIDYIIPFRDVGGFEVFSDRWIGCAKAIWCCFLIVFVSTCIYFLRNALLPELRLTKSQVFHIFCSTPLSLYNSFILCIFCCLFSLWVLYVLVQLEENSHSEMLVSSMSRVPFPYTGAAETLNSVLYFKNIVTILVSRRKESAN